MQVVILTQAEAADAHVMAELRKFLDAGATHIVSHQIGHDDRPDVGAPEAPPIPAAPFVPPVPAAAAAPDLAAIFGGAAAQTPLPPPVPSTVVAAAPSTVPAVPPASSPAATTVVVPSVPTPAPAVPAPPASAAPANPAGVAVDKAGLPWDGRIHATGKDGPVMTADGLWRKKRGVNDAAFIAKVEAELRAALAAGPAPVATPVAAPAHAPAVPLPPATISPAVAEATHATVAAQAAAPVGPTFQSLMVKLAPHMASGRLTQAKQMEVLAQFGLPSIAGLMQRPDLIPSIDAVFDSILA